MNILILNGGPRGGSGAACRKIASAAAEGSRAKGHSIRAFDLDGMDIKPCRGCFACWLKHPGTCAIKDDQEPVLRAMAAADILVWITPLMFGGYAPALKKALDRFIPNLLPFFTTRRGDVHHPLRYGKRPRLLVFGTRPSPDAEAERIFHGLARRNALNLDSVMTGSHVFHEAAEEAAVAARVRELLREAEGAI